MKKIIVILSLLLITFCSASYAGDNLQRFYARHRTDDNVESIKLPRMLLALIPKDRDTRRLLRCLKSVRIFQMEALKDRQAVLGELQQALAQDNFESLLQVTDDDSRVNIYINQDAQKIRHMFIMVDDDKELVLLQAKTRITFDQLNDLLKSEKNGNNKSGLKKLVSLKS
ncbi:DUF4252 domain-containing protein [Taibaiella koreensis]|uniref:DUF4252 domain-containing protein n=1 Tax=Taibaiella koreensis TaxID=1268548 RepID=UPI000E5A07A1|nr:DUF4252 domain-containing protein [Taibaiella koreensis]